MINEKLMAATGKLLKFGAVGGTVMAFNLGLLMALARFFSPNVSFVLAYIPTITLHFALNKWWVFRCARRDLHRQVLQYAAVAAVNFVVNLSLYNAALHFVAPHVVLANLLALPATTVTGFLLFRRHVFHATPAGKDAVR